MMRTWNPDKLELYRMNLRLFDNTNVTTSTAEGNMLRNMRMTSRYALLCAGATVSPRSIAPMTSSSMTCVP